MSWDKVNFNEFVPTEISAVTGKAVSLVDQFLAAARASLAFMRVYQGRLGGSTDIIGTALGVLVDTLEGFLQLGKVHVLFIPMTKIFPDDTGTLGGNARFYNVFSRALNDDFDPNRPQYTEEGDAVVMSVVMAGAPSYVEAMDVAAAFNRIFRPPSNDDLAANTIPVPQNLQARPVAHPSTKRVAVQLSWDVPKALFTFPYFPGIGTAVKRYAIIRSTSPTILNARSVIDLFGTRDLRDGMVSTDVAKHHKVVDTGTGTNSTYVDKEDDLDPTKTYYYAVAWELKVFEKGVETVVKFDRLSNVVKTRVRSAAPTGKAVPPNWHALPSLIQLVPSLADSVFGLVQQLKALSDRSSASSEGLKNALSLIETRLARLVEEMDGINSSFKQLAAALRQPIPTIHGTTFYGVGGNEFLSSQLISALNDKSDINRPPFDDNEYVLGICIVAGGPRIPDIQPIIDFLTALFGGGEAANPLLGILDVLEGAVDAVEETVFGEAMEPLPVNPDGTVVLPDGTSVDPADIDPMTGAPFVLPNPVIGVDGAALATNDPANPQAGETNVTPLSELC
jgi:hypothetical protein